LKDAFHRHYMFVMVVIFFRVYPHALQAALIHFNSKENF